MIYPGLVSITFRKLNPEQIVSLVERARLASIEWGGDVHVPHGDLRRADEVRRMTLERGLRVAAYGSYYRAGESEATGLAFASVLETALALGASTIRVWAGQRGSAEADAAYRTGVIDDLVRIAEAASSAGIAISTEFHSNTLTDDIGSLQDLFGAAKHPNLKAYWQPRVGATVESGMRELDCLKSWLTHVHVFQWTASGERRPLAEGETQWSRYLETLRQIPGDRNALLEFVRDDEPDAFLADAAILRKLLDRGADDGTSTQAAGH